MRILIVKLTSFGVAVGVWLCSLTVEAACPPGFASPEILGTVNTTKITEGSGIAASRSNPGVYWTHNDGARGTAYALSSNGSLLGSFKLNQTILDFEDIAEGPGPSAGVNYLYMGDIGSNTAIRDTVRIYRAAEPFVDPGWAKNPVSRDFAGVEWFDLKYPFGVYDAEALMVDSVGRELFVATKEPGISHLFHISLDALIPGAVQTLEYGRDIWFSKLSGADISRDGGMIAFRREDFAQLWVRNAGETVIAAMDRNPVVIPVVGPPVEPNGEGIGFAADGSGYVTISEGSNPVLYFFRKIERDISFGFSGPPQITSEGVFIPVQGCPGTQAYLQRSTDLSLWENIAFIQIDEGASYTDFRGNGPAFYRLVQIN